MAMGDKGELILSVLKSDIFTHFGHRSGHIGLFLEVSKEYQLFGSKKSSSLSDVVSQVNSALGVRKHRADALCVLRTLLDECSTETFAQHWDYWSKALVQIIQTEDDVDVLRLACDVLDLFLSHLKTSEFGHQFATAELPSIMTEVMQKVKEKDTSRYPTFVQLFRMFAEHFPGPCGPFAGRIEQFMLQLFDSTNTELQQAAAECFVILPRCGGGGSLGVKHTEFWSAAATKLLSALHDVLDLLYGPFETGLAANRPAPKLLQLPELGTQEPAYTMTLAVRFGGLCHALESLLSFKFPSVVRLPLLTVLELVDRTLTITPRYLLVKATSQRIHLSAVVPLIHQRVLGVLRALATSARGEMVPFAESVVSWLVQALNWTRATGDQEPGQQKPLTSLRCSVYETLVTWMHCLGCGSGVESVAADVIQHSVSDCTPPASSLKLQTMSSAKLGQVEAVFSTGSKRKTKRQKNFHAGNELDSVVTRSKFDSNAGVELCIASLEALRCLLVYVGCYLTPSHHRAIHELCRLPVALFNRRCSDDIPLPYSSPTCRRALYRLLLSAASSSLPRQPSPDHVIVKIFSMGLRDSDLEVRSCCAEALHTVENIIHPRLPVLGAPAISRFVDQVRDQWNAPELHRSSPAALFTAVEDVETSEPVAVVANGANDDVDMSDDALETNELISRREDVVDCLQASGDDDFRQESVPSPANEVSDDDETAETAIDVDQPVDKDAANPDRSSNSGKTEILQKSLGLSDPRLDEAGSSGTTSTGSSSAGLSQDTVGLSGLLAIGSTPDPLSQVDVPSSDLPCAQEQNASAKRKHGDLMSDDEVDGDNSDSEAVEIEPTVLELMVQSFTYKDASIS